jgi:hypothetical protein
VQSLIRHWHRIIAIPFTFLYRQPLARILQPLAILFPSHSRAEGERNHHSPTAGHFNRLDAASQTRQALAFHHNWAQNRCRRTL